MMCAAMLDRVRTTLHHVLTTPAGDQFFPVRFPKDVARRVNAVLGEPICSSAELERRRAGARRLEEAKRSPTKHAGAAPAVQAPVLVYFEKDRNARMLERIKEALDAKTIAYTLLDVTGDETAKNLVLREARCKEDDLPIVFVATTPVGGYNDLVDWDVSGKLAQALAGR